MSVTTIVRSILDMEDLEVHRTSVNLSVVENCAVMDEIQSGLP